MSQRYRRPSSGSKPDVLQFAMPRSVSSDLPSGVEPPAMTRATNSDLGPIDWQTVSGDDSGVSSRSSSTEFQVDDDDDNSFKVGSPMSPVSPVFVMSPFSPADADCKNEQQSVFFPERPKSKNKRFSWSRSESIEEDKVSNFSGSNYKGSQDKDGYKVVKSLKNQFRKQKSIPGKSRPDEEEGHYNPVSSVPRPAMPLPEPPQDTGLYQSVRPGRRPAFEGVNGADYGHYKAVKPSNKSLQKQFSDPPIPRSGEGYYKKVNPMSRSLQSLYTAPPPPRPAQESHYKTVSPSHRPLRPDPTVSNTEQSEYATVRSLASSQENISHVRFNKETPIQESYYKTVTPSTALAEFQQQTDYCNVQPTTSLLGRQLDASLQQDAYYKSVNFSSKGNQPCPAELNQVATKDNFEVGRGEQVQSRMYIQESYYKTVTPSQYSMPANQEHCRDSGCSSSSFPEQGLDKFVKPSRVAASLPNGNRTDLPDDGYYKAVAPIRPRRLILDASGDECPNEVFGSPTSPSSCAYKRLGFISPRDSIEEELEEEDEGLYRSVIPSGRPLIRQESMYEDFGGQEKLDAAKLRETLRNLSFTEDDADVDVREKFVHKQDSLDGVFPLDDDPAGKLTFYSDRCGECSCPTQPVNPESFMLVDSMGKRGKLGLRSVPPLSEDEYVVMMSHKRHPINNNQDSYRNQCTDASESRVSDLQYEQMEPAFAVDKAAASSKSNGFKLTADHVYESVDSPTAIESAEFERSSSSGSSTGAPESHRGRQIPNPDPRRSSPFGRSPASSSGSTPEVSPRLKRDMNSKQRMKEMVMQYRQARRMGGRKSSKPSIEEDEAVETKIVLHPSPNCPVHGHNAHNSSLLLTHPRSLEEDRYMNPEAMDEVRKNLTENHGPTYSTVPPSLPQPRRSQSVDAGFNSDLREFVTLKRPGIIAPHTRAFDDLQVVAEENEPAPQLPRRQHRSPRSNRDLGPPALLSSRGSREMSPRCSREFSDTKHYSCSSNEIGDSFLRPGARGTGDAYGSPNVSPWNSRPNSRTSQDLSDSFSSSPRSYRRASAPAATATDMSGLLLPTNIRDGRVFSENNSSEVESAEGVEYATVGPVRQKPSSYENTYGQCELRKQRSREAYSSVTVSADGHKDITSSPTPYETVRTSTSSVESSVGGYEYVAAGRPPHSVASAKTDGYEMVDGSPSRSKRLPSAPDDLYENSSSMMEDGGYVNAETVAPEKELYENSQSLAHQETYENSASLLQDHSSEDTYENSASMELGYERVRPPLSNLEINADAPLKSARAYYENAGGLKSPRRPNRAFQVLSYADIALSRSLEDLTQEPDSVYENNRVRRISKSQDDLLYTNTQEVKQVEDHDSVRRRSRKQMRGDEITEYTQIDFAKSQGVANALRGFRLSPTAEEHRNGYMTDLSHRTFKSTPKKTGTLTQKGDI